MRHIHNVDNLLVFFLAVGLILCAIAVSLSQISVPTAEAIEMCVANSNYTKDYCRVMLER